MGWSGIHEVSVEIASPYCYENLSLHTYQDMMRNLTTTLHHSYSLTAYFDWSNYTHNSWQA